jgi:hypothetical protein
MIGFGKSGQKTGDGGMTPRPIKEDSLAVDLPLPAKSSIQDGLPVPVS